MNVAMTPERLAAGQAMARCALEVIELEQLRRRNYRTDNCPKWHSVLTRLQQNAMRRQDQAGAEFERLGRAS